jgi:hypothetical protein
MKQQDDRDSISLPTIRQMEDAQETNDTDTDNRHRGPSSFIADTERIKADAGILVKIEEGRAGGQRSNPSDGTDSSICIDAAGPVCDPLRRLTKKERWNLLLSFLAWACTICNVNLGTYECNASAGLRHLLPPPRPLSLPCLQKCACYFSFRLLQNQSSDAATLSP